MKRAHPTHAQKAVRARPDLSWDDGLGAHPAVQTVLNNPVLLREVLQAASDPTRLSRDKRFEQKVLDGMVTHLEQTDHFLKPERPSPQHVWTNGQHIKLSLELVAKLQGVRCAADMMRRDLQLRMFVCRPFGLYKGWTLGNLPDGGGVLLVGQKGGSEGGFEPHEGVWKRSDFE